MTGLPASGKSTLAGLIEASLFEAGCSVVRLDGDNLRLGLCGDLHFGDGDRRENLRRAGYVAQLLFGYGHIVLCSFVSPFRRDRDFIRGLFPPESFAEVFVRCPLRICEERDPKGLYRRARNHQILKMTGIDSPYEDPLNPELIADTELCSTDDLAAELLHYLQEKAHIHKNL
jgi:adenylylsulfate kinase